MQMATPEQMREEIKTRNAPEKIQQEQDLQKRT